jgi:hypothetical protein
MFEFYGGLRGPWRKWHPDGTLKSNEYFPRATDSRPRNPADPIVDIDLDTLEFVEHPWGWGREPAPLPSFDEFRGLKCNEGGKDGYAIEQANGRQVVCVESLEIMEHKLHIAYKRCSLRFSDEFASRLIRAKVLGELCMDTYRGRVEKVAYKSIPTKQVVEVPY